MNRWIYIVCGWLMGLTLMACSDDDEVAVDSDVPSVTVLFPVNGLGDRSYSDNIYEGVCRAKSYCRLNYEVDFHEWVPADRNEAERMLTEWMERKSAARRLLIVAESSFLPIFETHPEWTSDRGRQVMWLDIKREDKRFHTRYIPLYGVSYMAGMAVTAMNIARHAVVLANPKDAPLLEAAEGYADGVRTQGGTFSTEQDVYLLAEQSGEGYDRSDEFFSLAARLEDEGYRFVFPVCGGSSQGLYRYTRYVTMNPEHHTFYTCGVDVDQQEYSTQVAFSLLKRYDVMVEDYIKAWVAEEKLSDYLYGGLSTGYSEMVVSKRYENEAFDTSLWSQLKEKALEAESIWEKKSSTTK